MALVVLFSTMSFTVTMHYCGETLVDYSLVNPDQSCGMEASEQINTDKNACDAIITQKSCCSNKILKADGHDDLKPGFHTLDNQEYQFITSFLYSYSVLFEPETLQNYSFAAYSPPILVRDVQTLDQVFRI